MITVRPARSVADLAPSRVLTGMFGYVDESGQVKQGVK